MVSQAMTSSNSFPLCSTHQDSCSTCVHQPIILAPLRYPHRRDKKLLFVDNGPDDNTNSTLRLPPLSTISTPYLSYPEHNLGSVPSVNGGYLTGPDSLSAISTPYLSYTEHNLGSVSRVNGGYLTGPDSLQLVGNKGLTEAFAAEYEKQPSYADVAYWAHVRPGMVSDELHVP